MGLVLVVYVIRNTYSAWQTFSSKMPLWFETTLVRCAYQSVVQISKSRSAEQNSSWTPDILIMHFSWFYLDSSELSSVVNLWCCWENRGCTAGGYLPVGISSLCTRTLLHGANMRAAGTTTRFNSNLFSPSELKQEHGYALQWEIRTGKKALKYFLLPGCLTVHHTFSFWG